MPDEPFPGGLPTRSGDRPAPSLPSPLSVTDVRARNVARVARAIALHGPLTRADLGDLTGLTRPTVRVAVNELEGNGFLSPVAERVDGGGRPAELLRFNPRVATVAAVRDRGSRLEIRLADVMGAELTRGVVDGPVRPDDLGTVVGEALRALHTALPQAGPLAAVTMLEPGLITRRGPSVTVTHRPRGWRDVPVVDLVSSSVPGVQVQVLGPAAAALLGEACAVGADNAVLLLVDRGLILSARVDGVVVTGAHGAAGEIGHMTVEPDGRHCACGRRGCLETVASGRSIARDLKALGLAAVQAQAPVAVLEAMTRDDVDEVLWRAAKRLGDALAWVASAYDPQLIVLGGTDYLVGADRFFRTVRATTDRLRSRLSHSTVDYRLASVDADLLGALRHSLASLPAPLRDIVAA